MNRVFITIGSVSIYWYSVLVLAAVFIGYNIIVSYSKKVNFSTSAVIDMMLWLVIWSIIGARLYYVIFNFDAYKDDLIDIFKIWNGGLAIYGAIISGSIYIFYYCLKHKLNFIGVMDIFSLSLLLGQAIGRWGNFFNQEAYGRKTTLESLRSLHLPKFIIDGMYIDGAYRQPTFLYESLWCLVGVIILYGIRKRISVKVGRQICFYLIWYGTGRFFIEGFRNDSLYFMNFRVSQIVSVVLIVVGIVGNVIIGIKKVGPVNDTGISESGRV